MAKKSFTKGLDNLLTGSGKPAKRGRPKTNFKEVTKSFEQGTKENETRATFIVAIDQLEKVKALAYWERTSIKDVLATALQAYIAKARDLSKAIESYKSKSKGAKRFSSLGRA